MRKSKPNEHKNPQTNTASSHKNPKPKENQNKQKKSPKSNLKPKQGETAIELWHGKNGENKAYLWVAVKDTV